MSVYDTYGTNSQLFYKPEKLALLKHSSLVSNTVSDREKSFITLTRIVDAIIFFAIDKEA
jgi:hypothetical protein